MKKVIAILLLISVFTLTACGSKEKTNDSDKTNTNVETNIKDYSGLYKSDDSSELTINKNDNNYKVDISLYRLAAFNDCSVDEIKDNVLYIRGTDPNSEIINFKFDYNTKILTVLESSWNLLNVGDSFTFDK